MEVCVDLVLIGISHESTPIEVREKVDFGQLCSKEILQEFLRTRKKSSGFLLSTCNRVELYLSGKPSSELFPEAEDVFLNLVSEDFQKMQSYLYRKENKDAVTHLFRVASSLDSMIVGEPQILGQVKEAVTWAREQALLDPFFERLTRKAFSVAKRVRTETDIGKQAVSVSSTAVDLAQRIFGRLEGRKVMLLGAGEMAELAARHLTQKGVQELLFANRSYDRAVDLAKEFKGIPLELNRFEGYLEDVDVVIVSTASREYLVKKAMVESLMKKRRQRPIFFIDISVPRNVDPSAHELEDVYLYNIDDLKAVVKENMDLRVHEADKAEKIVQEEMSRFMETSQVMQADPVLAKLIEKCEVMRRSEVSRFERRAESLSEPLRGEVEALTSALVRKLLHGPIHFLKDSNSSHTLEEKTVLLEKLFSLSSGEEKKEEKR